MPTANVILGPNDEPGFVYGRSQFQDVLNLLREEKPLYLAWWTNPLRGDLQTGPEPVGEDEGP